MTRTNWMRTLLGAACALGLSLTPAIGQQDPEQREERRQRMEERHSEMQEHRRERRLEIEERIRERFTSMLRSELALSDEQAETVLPLMSDLEDFKREIRRERHAAVRALRTGMQEGASDDELQAALDDLDRIEDDLRSAERSAMVKIDGELNTRQRVKLRFFVHEFRRSIERRLTERAERMERHRERPERPRPDSR
ncbi:MAG: hypothetical protein GTN89_12305 [Acidobacteria bacterium]|nr:hypothetical protein [Acidobacteriota bacterium]NIM63263.1 hypothetical protein [Acidobacteriota bacterium]NIO60056.1 hypothetical protein [Acidobacteriota bacterium]NIQ31127.1 hypothetical protein [Acidobacteriota bacterium]NIQ86236.1 hypothetical protein [Acidobacteriota bacterium]